MDWQAHNRRFDLNIRPEGYTLRRVERLRDSPHRPVAPAPAGKRRGDCPLYLLWGDVADVQTAARPHPGRRIFEPVQAVQTHPGSDGGAPPLLAAQVRCRLARTVGGRVRAGGGLAGRTRGDLRRARRCSARPGADLVEQVCGGGVSIETNWLTPSSTTPRSITVYALKENARPIGFAPWPEPDPEPETANSEPTRKRKRKTTTISSFLREKRQQ